MRIVCDAGIPYATEAFSDLGHLSSIPGREIERSDVVDADALVIRSVTRVDARLLEGTRVKFVGAATAGTDHVDLAALAEAQIEFAHAPGTNAMAVAEHVLAALSLLERDRGRDLGPIGVVGFGNIGRRLTRKLRALDREVLVTDPPLERRILDGTFDEVGDLGRLAVGERFHDLDTVLTRCELITVHVPLERGGAHATWRMLDESRLTALAPGAVVVNTSRGGVVDEDALMRVATARNLELVIDTWTGEPRLRWDLLQQPFVRLATAHLAGYSVDAKIAATRAVHHGLARFLGREPSWDGPSDILRPDPIVPGQGGARAGLAACLDAATQVSRRDAELRALAPLPDELRRVAWDGLRGPDVTRRELEHQRCDLQGWGRPDEREQLARLLGRAGMAVTS